MTGSSARVPHYLKAKTEDELLGLMLKNNLQKGREFNYFSIQFVKSNWFAWYYTEVELKKQLNESFKNKG